MSVFDTLITDRTSADAGTEKGLYSASDLNRVEQAAQELATRLTGLGYPVSINTKTTWDYSSIPSPSDMSRYLANIETLRSAYYVLPTTPETPQTMEHLDYQKANDIEQILADVDRLIKNTIDSWNYAGEFYSGEA